MERDETGTRKVDPYHLLFQGGQFYLLGRSHERDALRVFRLSRIRGKVAYATKAEHDFRRPTREDFDPREYANRADVAVRRDAVGTAEVLVSERIAWQVERHFGRFGEVRPGDDGSVVFATPYASARQVASWVLRLGEHVQRPRPARAGGRGRRARRAARRAPRRRRPRARRARRPARAARRRRGHGRPEPPRPGRHRDPAGALRAPRHARVDPHRGRPRAASCSTPPSVRERLQISDRELREDINVLNVVNFGGGSYVLYAEVTDDGHDRGRPRALRGQLRAPGAAAARRGQGARRRDRPHRRAPARGRADVGAREDRRRAGRGPDGAGPAGREHGRRRLRHRARRQRGDRRRPDCCGSTTTSPTRTSSSSGRSSRTRSSTGARAGTSPRSTRRATTSATSGWTASATRR